MTPFSDAVSVPRLTAAFAKTFSNGGGPGGDGETLAAFSRAAEMRIARLSYELESGLYRPGPLRRLVVPKRDGGSRRLSIPTVTDRVAQGAAAAVLSERLEPHFEPSSFGYRPGRSVRQAVARVSALRRQGYGVVVDGDIRAFFDEVPHAMVLAKLGALVKDPRMTALAALWLESFSGEGRGLAQGSPLSPVLSNLHLDAIDEAFEGGPVRIVRFADDFVLLAKDRAKAEAGLARVAALLREHGLELNEAKTSIVPFEKAFSFLGHLFVRSVEIEAGEAPTARLPLSVGAISTVAPDGPSEVFEASAPAAAEPPPAAVEIVGRAPADPLADLAADRDEDDFAAGLAPLYLLAPGRRLRTEGEAFVVLEDGRRLLAVPAALVGRIELGPEVEADDAALRLAATLDVPVSFLDGLGRTQATLSPAVGADAGLHLAQARLALDGARALEAARALAAGRIRNARALLKRLNRRRKRDDVEEACRMMDYARRKAATAPDIDRVRGAEGEGARLYWPALGRCLEHGFSLDRRREEAGANPVNAALDFTASLLARDMRAAVTRAGLHPGFGALHAVNDRRDACVYDLMEAFRAPLAEGLSVYLFNNRIIASGDWGPKAQGFRLSGGAARKLVQTYEAWLARPVKNPRTGRFSTWRGLLLTEARAFAAALREDAAFAPYALDH